MKIPQQLFPVYCIVHPTLEIRRQKIVDLTSSLNIHALDQNILNGESISIADVRKVNSFLSKKPFVSSHKMVVIEEANNLTIEAQQALLKILEEPPNKSLLFIGTTNTEQLLPTIISRCFVIELSSTHITNETQIQTHSEFWQKLISQSIGKRMLNTTDLSSSRENALAWIMLQLDFLHEQLIIAYTTPNKCFAHPTVICILLRLILNTQQRITKNVSLKLALDHLFLAAPNHLNRQ